MIKCLSVAGFRYQETILNLKNDAWFLYWYTLIEAGYIVMFWKTGLSIPTLRVIENGVGKLHPCVKGSSLEASAS